MARIRERYEEEGYNGLLDRRRGKPSRRRVPVATVEKVFALYREKYFDLNVQHFHEKLQAEHGIELSYSWVKQADLLRFEAQIRKGREQPVQELPVSLCALESVLVHKALLCDYIIFGPVFIVAQTVLRYTPKKEHSANVQRQQPIVRRPKRDGRCIHCRKPLTKTTSIVSGLRRAGC